MWSMVEARLEESVAGLQAVRPQRGPPCERQARCIVLERRRGLVTCTLRLCGTMPRFPAGDVLAGLHLGWCVASKNRMRGWSTPILPSRHCQTSLCLLSIFNNLDCIS